MALIIDFLLLAASGSACFYCWVLNKRLKSLTGAKDGINVGIAALSQSAQEMQAAMAETKTAAGNTVFELQELLARADATVPELRQLLEKIDGISAQAADDAEKAANNFVDILEPHIEEAKTAARTLLDSLEAAAESAENEKEKARPARTPARSRKKPAAKAEDDDEIAFVKEDDEDQAA